MINKDDNITQLKSWALSYATSIAKKGTSAEKMIQEAEKLYQYMIQHQNKTELKILKKDKIT